MGAINIYKEEKMAEKINKKYRVICNERDDEVAGRHNCHVNGKNYSLDLNTAIDLDESVLSYLKDAKIYKVPGIVLTDESTIIDIARQTFHTNVTDRFQVTEV
jgi:hypothetical protein